MEDQATYETVSGYSKTYRKKVICDCCKGEGVIQSRHFYGHTEGWIPQNHVCAVCNGKGILERMVKVSYRKV